MVSLVVILGDTDKSSLGFISTVLVRDWVNNYESFDCC